MIPEMEAHRQYKSLACQKHTAKALSQLRGSLDTRD